jgi:hypothetical protein
MKPELLKAIDPYLRRVGLYSAYTLDEKEFVGHADGWNIKKILKQNGYENPPTFLGVQLQAAKLHPKHNVIHDWSFRKVDPENNRKQYHIHAWNVPSVQKAELASHYEFRPDIAVLEGETLSDAIERLQTHYRPEWDTDEYVQGKADQTVRELVE